MIMNILLSQIPDIPLDSLANLFFLFGNVSHYRFCNQKVKQSIFLKNLLERMWFTQDISFQKRLGNFQLQKGEETEVARHDSRSEHTAHKRDYGQTAGSGGFSP